jgi:hypothetical protein
MMMKRLGYGLSVFAAAAAFVAAEPQMHLAFEDRGDPRPRQFAMSAEIAGRALALVISWTSHHDFR